MSLKTLSPDKIKEAIKITVRETSIDAKTLLHIENRINSVSTVGIGSQKGMSHIYTFNEHISQEDFFSFMLELKLNLVLLTDSELRLDLLFDLANNMVTNDLTDNQELCNFYKWEKRERGYGIGSTTIMCICFLKMYISTFRAAIIAKTETYQA